MLSNPVSFEIKNSVLYARAKGEISFKDIVEHYQTLFSHPDFYVGIPALYDFSKVNKVVGDMAHFEQTAREMGDSNIIDKPCNVAIFVSAEHASVAKVFEAYSLMMDYTLMNVRVFYQHDLAREWLNIES